MGFLSGAWNSMARFRKRHLLQEPQNRVQMKLFLALGCLNLVIFFAFLLTEGWTRATDDGLISLLLGLMFISLGAGDLAYENQRMLAAPLRAVGILFSLLLVVVTLIKLFY